MDPPSVDYRTVDLSLLSFAVNRSFKRLEEGRSSPITLRVHRGSTTERAMIQRERKL